MKKLEERRKIEQIPIYDKDGRIQYYIIPNYKLVEEFETFNERKFHRVLINVIRRINEEYKEQNKYIQISSQVAINRIISINNQRNTNLFEELRDKSIDYVLFDLNSGKIECLIELDDNTHLEEKRKLRDNLINKMFNGLVKIKHIEKQDNYNEDEIYQIIIK